VCAYAGPYCQPPHGGSGNAPQWINPLVANGSNPGFSRGCPGVGLASQQEGYPCIHFMQHEEDQAVAQGHATVLSLCPVAMWMDGSREGWWA